MRNKIDDAVDIKEVRSFLRNHPDFFDNNSDILETMVIHHKTDGAISIVERHLQKLQEKNKLLNEKLNHLIENAAPNRQFSSHFGFQVRHFSIMFWPFTSRSFNFALSIVCSEILISSLLTNIS